MCHQLVLELLQCRWLLDNKTCDENELYELLVRKNKELSEWSDLRWRKARVPIDVVDKARKNNFFLGCTDQWMLFERKSSLETMGRRIDGSGYAAKGQIKVRTPHRSPASGARATPPSHMSQRLGCTWNLHRSILSSPDSFPFFPREKATSSKYHS